ncbi:MAG: metal-dependent transcriptional regulator [Candidatus Binatia bacterium]
MPKNSAKPTAMEDPKVSRALEDYLKAIYQLSEEGKPVIAARVAAEAGVSASTIFATLRRLAKEGYVTINRRKEIHLTPDGKKVAENIVRRHFLTERFLTDLLGLDWIKAHQEAHRLEHAISQDVEERLAKLLKHPTTCPHGNPIPGASSGPARKTIPLSEAVDGQQVHLDCITEGGERDVRLLSFLEEHGLRPGAKVHVLDVAPSLGMMTLSVNDHQFSLGIEAAKKIRVH